MIKFEFKSEEHHCHLKMWIICFFCTVTLKSDMIFYYFFIIFISVLFYFLSNLLICIQTMASQNKNHLQFNNIFCSYKNNFYTKVWNFWTGMGWEWEWVGGNEREWENFLKMAWDWEGNGNDYMGMGGNGNQNTIPAHL